MAAIEKIKHHPIVLLRKALESHYEDLRAALPANIKPEKFISTVLVAAQGNPDLLTVDQQSLWMACLRCAQDGVLPDGREAVILPYRSKDKGMIAQYQIMISGMLKRFRNSGEFKSIMAGVVRKGDEFAHWVDEHGEHIKHVPSDSDEQIEKAYAIAKTKGGGIMIKVMTVADIEKRRAKSKAKDGPMWSDFYDEAAMKTVLRNLHKRLPSSADIAEMLERDDDPEAFKPKPFAGDATAALDHFAKQPEPRDNTPDSYPEGFMRDDGSIHHADEDNNQPGAEFADEAEEASMTEAFLRGQKDKRAGLQRRAVPGEYRTSDKTAEAKEWIAGWDSV